MVVTLIPIIVGLMYRDEPGQFLESGTQSFSNFINSIMHLSSSSLSICYSNKQGNRFLNDMWKLGN